ncbi:MAG: glycerol-3-phosphate 1-O-acyltransferase PlsY [Clostridia bacterium]|nr:glycerol-3-phosphate 1-O-acyltransferase PlsY [Clostridia bacterium]
MLFELFFKDQSNLEIPFISFLVICGIVSYLIGSLNFGIIFSRAIFKEDVRSSGSGNAGATNMLRTYGKRAGIFTFLCDGAKTAVAMATSYLFMPPRYVVLGMFFAGIFCMVGHTYPLYFKFKGGKGVACFAVLVLMTSIAMKVWYVFLILFVMFFILVIGTKFVSLGSIICALVYPILLNRVNRMVDNNPFIMVEVLAVLAGLFVVFQHRTNLSRLFNGTENKISLSKKKKKENEETNE